MEPSKAPGPPPEPSNSASRDEHTFTADLWLWDARKADTWTFVTLPAEISAAVEDHADARGPRAGFGSVRVRVRIGTTTWHTSVFPDSATGCFVLPIKKSVRRANEIEAGDAVTIHLRPV